MKGARKAPARAPHEIPISWAIKVGGLRAMTTERMMKKATRTRMTTSWVFSDISLTKVSFRKSNVSVELEVRTSEDRVDMEAESTRTMTMPIRKSGRVESIWGTMES